MSVYIALVLAGFGLGLIDWLNKGLPMKKYGWEKLSRFKRGWGWPVMFFGFWVAIIYAFVNNLHNPWYWLAMFLFINEDASYYLYKRIAFQNDSRHTYWNKWLGIWKSSKSYWITVVIVNVIMAGVIIGVGM